MDETTQRCKLAFRDGLDNYSLEQFLGAKHEKLEVLRRFVETAGVVPERAQALFDEIFSEVMAELEYRRACVENEQKRRIGRNRLRLAKDIKQIEEELASLAERTNGVAPITA